MRWRKYSTLFLALALFSFPARAEWQTLPVIVVMADKSLMLPLSEIAREYSRVEQATVSLSFNSARDQKLKLEEGASLDLLISARPQWLEALKSQGLIDVYTFAPLVQNRLALIAPEESPLHIDLEEEKAFAPALMRMQNDFSFTIGSPESLSEGFFAIEALRHSQALKEVEPYLLYPRQTAQLLQLVAQGAYGFAYYSDALSYPGVRVLSLVPETWHSPAVYHAAVVAGENMTQARKFLVYLKSEPVKEIWKRHGLLIPQEG